jgi:hypothetical protein
MPGVLLGISWVLAHPGLTIGIDAALDEQATRRGGAGPGAAGA